MRKLLILLIKYIPIVQSIGMLLNNILYLANACYNICYIIDFIIGNSLLTTIFLLICSYVFKFCNWHRILVYGNFINIVIAYINYIFFYEITDFVIPVTSIVIISLTILISMYLRFNCHEEKSIKTTNI